MLTHRPNANQNHFFGKPGWLTSISCTHGSNGKSCFLNAARSQVWSTFLGGKKTVGKSHADDIIAHMLRPTLVEDAVEGHGHTQGNAEGTSAAEVITLNIRSEIKLW